MLDTRGRFIGQDLWYLQLRATLTSLLCIRPEGWDVSAYDKS